MSSLQIIGILIAILSICFMAIYSGTNVKKSSQNSNSAAVVAGLIMGTLVGGSSTIGTAQLAYQFGMSAWWFTLGAGIGCLCLTLVYLKPLRASKSPTLVGMIREEYGAKTGMAASILNALGTFINIISQLLAASAVVLVVWPNMGTLMTVIISAIFMVLYVIFGGTKGAGMVGIIKLLLLYVSMVVCGILALKRIGGVSELSALISSFTAETGISYGSIFARGVGKDLGSCFSLILGVLTTQTYGQAIMSAKSDRSARIGGLVSTFMIPPIGIFGIIVGLFMRTVTDPATFVAKTALTRFALDYLPDLFGGIVLGTLFVASVGTGAGLALGISTIINNDIIKRVTHAFDDENKSSALSKALIVLVLGLACCLSTGSLGDTILNFAFMSMGLRGATVFVPLTCAIYFHDRIKPVFAIASIIAGPVLVLVFGTVLAGTLPIDSLFAGILVSIIVMGIGLMTGKKA